MKLLKGCLPFIVLVILSGCADVFHDLTPTYSINAKLAPQINYTFPETNGTDIDRNKSILISFNKEMDEDSVMLPDCAFVLRDSTETNVDCAPELVDNMVLILSPLGDLDELEQYSVNLVRDIEDTQGKIIQQGYRLSFTTGDTEAIDSDLPFVDSVSPSLGSLSGTQNVVIKAVFNEDINFDSVDETTFIVQKDGGGTIDGEFYYDGPTYTVEFIPDKDLDLNAQYLISILGVKDLANHANNPAKVSNFRTGAIMRELDDAKNISGTHAFGSFGDQDDAEPGIFGRVLRDNQGNPLISYYDYGDLLTGIFDTGISDSLSKDKYIRIVENGRNITDQTGLCLTPRAKVLSGTGLISPPKNECYIDHVLGMFLLPRPVYWSRCEDSASITSPEISITGYAPTLDAGTSIFSGKFGNSWGRLYFPWDATYYYMRPFGNTAVDFMQKGTISFWFRPSFSLQCSAFVDTYITNDLKVSAYSGDIYNHLEIVSEGAVIAQATGMFTNNAWHHIYIIWDKEGSLSYGAENNRTVKVYVNGVLLVNTTEAIIGNQIVKIGVRCQSNIGSGSSSVDNVKVWNHVVSDGDTAADFEYNGGAGREDALHDIYDELNGYRPVLDDSSIPKSGVGYYYLP